MTPDEISRKTSDPAFSRAQLVRENMGAVYIVFHELGGLINKTQLAKQYFKKTHGWLSQKINGCTLRDRQASFSDAEIAQLAAAFRDIAKRLEEYADELEAAKPFKE